MNPPENENDFDAPIDEECDYQDISNDDEDNEDDSVPNGPHLLIATPSDVEEPHSENEDSEKPLLTLRRSPRSNVPAISQEAEEGSKALGGRSRTTIEDFDRRKATKRRCPKPNPERNPNPVPEEPSIASPERQQPQNQQHESLDEYEPKPGLGFAGRKPELSTYRRTMSMNPLSLWKPLYQRSQRSASN
jgi:hypothetical protein